MAFPYSAHKTYVTGEVLTASDLNSTDTNHINNNIPESIDDYSASVTEQRTTSDPDLDGAGNAPTTLSEEIEGIRHQLARLSTLLVGGTYWYNLVSTTQFQSPLGSASLPTYSFTGDTNTGLYSATADNLNFTTGGTLRLTLSTTSFTNTLPFYAANGSAAAPSYAFASQPDSGMFVNPSNGDLSFSEDGSSVVLMNQTGLLVTPDGTVGVPAWRWSSDSTTGLYRIGTGNMGVAASGGNVASFASTGVSLKGTTTNDSASSGFIGEYIESTIGTANAPTSAQYGDATSISLTAGDWDISAGGNWERNGATWTEGRLAISTTAGNSATGITFGQNGFIDSWASSASTPNTSPIQIPTYRLSLSATTTVYLKYYSAYTAGLPRLNGAGIWARRVR